ncbi:peroxidase-like isoform X1 [Maniola jurtina]|uniref:peroxidase-like isoform X1 n=1 Tax=Maniola jurtina TaxID=191418 RepID=UPI001E68A218|nr:peroxidase-like isoform X1 [Maniola jurtina]
MDGKRSRRNILSISVLLYLFCASVSACFSCGWETLFEDLLSDLCPLFSTTTQTINELFLSSEEDDPLITKNLVAESFRCGRELAREARQRANKLVRNGVSLEACSPTMLHFFTSKLPSEVKKASELSNELLSATKILQMKVCSNSDVTPNTFLAFLENNPVRPHDISCKPVSVSCLGSNKYRSFDGACNNLQRPAWGRRGAPFTRITSPRYADGIYAMPVGRSGRALPNPRALSSRVFAEQPRAGASRVLTALNMQWGQIVTHDMVFHVMESTDEGAIQCCLGEGQDVLPQSMLNDKCIPICVAEDDPFYRQHGVRCLNFVRSVTAPRDDCSLGHAEQMNTVSSFLDGSILYGSDPKLASKLRSKCGGRLKEETRRHCKGGFLPSVDDKLAVCDLRNLSEPCYLAGDTRINQTPTLAALHTLLLREHNRVADVLADLNPLWSDEKLFQEARRVVVAEIQHITYQEWLPLNFGESYLRYYRISPSSLYSRDYNDEVNPGVINSFGAAAFRFLHTVVPDTIMLCPASCQAAYLHKLSDHYFNPSLMEATPESFDDLIRGIITHRSAEVDPHCTAEITNLLFKSRNKWGLDLIAMDIQRGRDHGIASYNDYREICGLQRATTFQDLASEISQDRIAALGQLYESVDDIDLFVGGALERPVPGSILGHTFQCIVAEQFYRTRVGDRFFYDNSEMAHSFTPDQLKELKKASMARLICDNTGVKHVQRRAFEVESGHNPKYSCDDYHAIPCVDLTAWKRPKFELYD